VISVDHDDAIGYGPKPLEIAHQLGLVGADGDSTDKYLPFGTGLLYIADARVAAFNDFFSLQGCRCLHRRVVRGLLGGGGACERGAMVVVVVVVTTSGAAAVRVRVCCSA